MLRWSANATWDWGKLGAHDSAARNRDLDILGRARYDLRVEARDVDSLGLVLIRRGDNLDDFVARKIDHWNISSRAMHQVGVEHTKHRLVSDNEKICLFSFQLKDNGLQANGKIVVRLLLVSILNTV